MMISLALNHVYVLGDVFGLCKLCSLEVTSGLGGNLVQEAGTSMEVVVDAGSLGLVAPFPRACLLPWFDQDLL